MKSIKDSRINRRVFLAMSCGFVINVAFGDSQDLHKTRVDSLKNAIIVYYSRTLNTHILAKYLQSLIGGDLVRIQTAQDYPKDYQQLVELSAQQSAEGIFPLLKPYALDLRGYDNIFIATPLWNGDICPPIKSLLRGANLGDKAISLIITSAGFGLGVSVDSAKKLVKIGSILDYEFSDYEKVLPNLRTINKSKITQNRAYDTLDKDKIMAFLARI